MGRLAPVELPSRLASGEKLQLVDVRERPEYAAGRIASSHLLPMAEFEQRTKELDPAVPVIAICRSGKRSADAAERLVRLGFRDVAQLEGGLQAWEQAGLALERDPHAPWGLERQVRFAAGLMVLFGLDSLFCGRPALGCPGWLELVWSLQPRLTGAA